MDTDCLFTIFNKLDTVKLLKLSEIKQFVPVIELVLRLRFSKFVIIIGGARELHKNSTGKYTFSEVTEYSSLISIEDFPTAVKILSNFGHLIDNLKILRFRGWTEASIKQIHQLINQHCSETLKSINILKTEENIFDAFTIPFTMVQEVSLMSESGYEKFGNFSKMFPATRRLYMNSFNVSSLNSSSYVLPHLEYVSSNFRYTTETDLTKTLFGNIITNNPNVSNIILHGGDADILRFLSNETTNLETLEIYYYYCFENLVDPSIRFDKLKKLKIGSYSMPPIFSSESLEELNVPSADIGFLLRFISNFKNLTKFESSAFYFETDIFSLASTNWKVTEVKFYCQRDVTARSIFHLIERNQNLRKLQLLTPTIDEHNRLNDDISGFHFLTKNEWKIGANDATRRILLEKNI